jgi:hypothetical protein
MTEDAIVRKGTAILQSCSVSLGVVPGSCSETNITSSDNAHEVISIKVEEDTAVTIKVEEIPAIKAEPEEVSYLSVCLLLDTCHQCPIISCVIHDLHLYICSVKQLLYVEWEFQSLLGLCDFLVRQCACN